ncbi:cupin domain-containing protein [Plantactinospora endophytica]|uniref:Gentisate 1,2-dioxygenase n=1 Tax=Plantactinospora endophytica TaxID=673535 RepID=A0ABQ4E1P5_9ACTN|nr:cupin domain-containing protein [Plantactinospora endophytica]GIG88626.1 gentisate 1,2-dioxygenase [Plantactinospora endophytica]
MATRRFTAPADFPEPAALDEFYGALAEADVQPLWAQQGLMPRTPPLRDVPALWKWKRLRALAERSGELVPIDRGGDRRVLAFANPGGGGLPYATSTLWGAVQYLGPGELAPAHHHTPGALRFVLEGSGVWTLVDSDPVAMNPGDLVLTPSWRWHEHHNPGTGPMLWFDGLDIPMVRAVDAVFFEDGPDRMTNRAVDTVSRAELRYAGAPGLLPLDDEPPAPHSPLLAYRRAETDRALTRLLAARGGPHAALRFADPTSGADVMPTLRCAMHRLLPGLRTPTTRRTGSSIWVAYSGAATAVVDGHRFDLEPGDVLAVPSWAPFDLAATEPTDLFSVSDAPVLEAMRLARTETLPAHQELR